MLIDFHTHIFEKSVVESRVNYFDDSAFSMLYSPNKSKLIDHKTMLDAMTDSGIDISIAMGFPWLKEIYCEKQNMYFSKLKGYTNGKIIPFGSIPLNDRFHFYDWAMQIKEFGLCGIGEVAFYNDGLTNKNASVLSELLAAASRFSLPVCLHVTEPVGKDYTGKHTTDLSVIFSMLKDFPDLTLILAHWGGGLVFYELMKSEENVFKNIYYDTAASLYLYKDNIFKIAVQTAGSEKILFGSDYPLIKFNKYFDSINSSVENENDRNNIYYLNALRILRNQNIFI